MINQKTSVFFDTNSYRQIVRNKNKTELSEFFNLVHLAEKEKNIEPISTLTVNLELSANLVEEKDGINFKNCLNSLQFLTQHCFDSEKELIRIASFPFFQISAMMFGALPMDFDKESKRISKHFESFKSFDKQPNLSNKFYEFIKTTLTKYEQSFSNNLVGLVNAANYGMEQIHPKKGKKTRKRILIKYFKSDTYAHNLSLKSLKIVAEQLGIELEEQEFQNRARFLRQELPMSSAFFQWILCEIITKNIDMNSKNSKARRWNWLWDYQISFLISKNTINDGKMILVTSDKEITEILKENGLENNVMDIEQYLNFLNINGSCQHR